MVQAMIQISEETNHILNIVKAKNNLRDKSEAINLVTRAYGEELLEPELRPEFIKKMEMISKQKNIRVDNFLKRYGMK